ncbi:MAG: hypothetical protein PVH45_01010 [Candidatus Omnitrophota bacterium]|jgi:hypothetical protein
MESSLSIKKENLRELRDIVKSSGGVEEVLVVTNAGDGDIVKEALERIKKDTFRADGKVKVNSHEEATRRGQWLGLLDAYKSWIEREKIFNKGSVSIGGMYPGKGTRMSPLTQRLHGIKPFFPMLIREDKGGDWLTGAAASLYTCNHVAYHLKRMGFSGMIWKWGDEPQIAATRLKDLDWNLSYVDFVRFGSTEVITENLAQNKEWFKVDERNNLIVQVRRRPRKDLLKKLGLEDTPDASAIVHIGSPAFSYLFLEEAVKIFGDWQGWVDVDGYLCDALTLNEKGWKEELELKADDPDLRQLLEDHPEFYSACQKLKQNISARRNGRPLQIKVVDFGNDLYWGDIGQLAKARQSIHAITQKGDDGDFARVLAGLYEVKPDDFGNTVVGDCVYPKDGGVRNSVLIDARFYGSCKIDNSVIIQSDLANAEVMGESVVYDSTALGLKMDERAFSFKSIGENIKIERDGVHTNMPVDLRNIGKGLEDWNADSRQNVGSAENYKEVRFGNPRTFEEQQRIMRQREIKPDRIETEIDEKFRKPLLERMKSNG